MQSTFRFFLTQSKRSYVVQDGQQVYAYCNEEKRWKHAHTKLEDLVAHSRTQEIKSELSLPPWARHAFYKQFGHDSRRASTRAAPYG